MKKTKANVEVVARPRTPRVSMAEQWARMFLYGVAFAAGMYAVIVLVDALGI